ncbi:MAG TPA: hypothetical protein VJ872_02180 [Nocardioides sp.]|nr:hypothetical protein [Nocardioides sp.]
MRRLLGAALIAGSLTVLGVSPAHAATAPAAPTLSDLSTSVAGHVTGTITGDVDAQSAWVCFAHCHVNTGQVYGGWLALDSTTHSTTFDLPTWGYGDGTVTAVVCPNAAATGCTVNDTSTSPPAESTTLTPTDITPSVTFSPADGVVHDGDQLTATVSDPGGGWLEAIWSADDNMSGPFVTQLAHDGIATADPVTITIGKGAGHVAVVRCNEHFQYDPCQPFDSLSYQLQDTEAPDVTSMTVSSPFVRPEATDSTNSVFLHAAGPNASSNDWWEVLDGQGHVVRSILDGWAVFQTDWNAYFDGRDDNGLMLPSGLYTIQLRDPAGNVSATTVKVRVQRLVSKTFVKAVTAKASKTNQYVGRCSKLASPSSHGWAGSLGYFANTRCRSTTGPDSTVATEHGVALPAAATYRDVRISAYGGAAKGFGRSVAVMFYEDPSRNRQVAQAKLGPKVGTWAGPAKAVSTMAKTINGTRYVFWSVGTAARQHYDVKGFTVTVHYQVWV